MEYMLKRLLEGTLMTPERAHVYWNGTFSDPEKAALARMPLPGAMDTNLSAVARRDGPDDGLAPYSWFDQKYYLGDDILVKSDRMSMAHSLEVRPPFLDHRIVEFAATLPATMKVNGARQKIVLKSLMEGKLPPAVLSRKKQGLDIPAHHWLRGPLRSFMTEVLADGTAEYPELFDSAEVERLVRCHLERRGNVGYHLWGLMILFLWMRKWNVQVGEANAQYSALSAQPSTNNVFSEH